MRRLALLLTAAAVPVLTACGTAPGVPQWKDGVAMPASPSVTSSEAARDLPAGVAGGSAAPATTAAGTAAAATAAPEPSGTTPPGRAAAAASFADAVRGRLPEVAVDRRPEEITEIGGAACAQLATGQRRGAAVDEVTGYGVADADARELVRLARTFLCPG
jgi:hypothetical protein